MSSPPPSGVRPGSGVRPPPREVIELRDLAARQPDLAPAAELHAQLLAAVRRVESRIATPGIDVSDDVLSARLARGVQLASFGEFTIDWTEVRLLIRQVTDVLRRMDMIDPAAAGRLYALGRDGSLAGHARAWYEGQESSEGETDPLWPEVLQWSLRPFLSRAAEVLSRRVALDAWRRGSCPVCAAEPEFAAYLATGERILLCGRCHARWPFDHACPFCGNDDPDRLRTSATPDRVYRIVECLACRRYLKGVDTQVAGRALLPSYDPVATLPLDALMLRK